MSGINFNPSKNKKEELTTKFFKRLSELGRSNDKKQQMQGVIELRQIIDDIWQNGFDNGISFERMKSKNNG
jgi:hypothetical protein